MFHLQDYLRLLLYYEFSKAINFILVHHKQIECLNNMLDEQIYQANKQYKGDCSWEDHHNEKYCDHLSSEIAILEDKEILFSPFFFVLNKLAFEMTDPRTEIVYEEFI